MPFPKMKVRIYTYDENGQQTGVKFEADYERASWSSLYQFFTALRQILEMIAR